MITFRLSGTVRFGVGPRYLRGHVEGLRSILLVRSNPIQRVIFVINRMYAVTTNYEQGTIVLDNRMNAVTTNTRAITR